MKIIRMYTKGYCPYCDRAKALLKSRGLSYEEVSVEAMGDAERAELMNRSGMRTVPQIFIIEEGKNERLIGGYTELAELDQKDRLQSLH